MVLERSHDFITGLAMWGFHLPVHDKREGNTLGRGAGVFYVVMSLAAVGYTVLHR